MSNRRILSMAVACAMGGISARMAAADVITIDGMRDAGYGAPIAIQTNNTGFGDNGATDGNTANGSELDAAYALVEGGYLKMLFTGNVETNFNHLNIFIADNRAGQSTLQVANNQLASMNGSKFSPGFAATYALDINGGPSGQNPPTWFTNKFDLTQANPSSQFLGQFNGAVGSSFNVGGTIQSVNNSNTAGVVGGQSSAANQTDAAAVATGFEIAIPLSQLGSPTGSVKVLVDINGGNDGFLSNQFLAGLQTPSNNVGNAGKFDFSATANQYFTVNIPAGGNTNGVWAATGGGSWPNSANWTGGLVPAAAGDSATFGPAITSAATITLDGSRTLGQITFNNSNSYTIAPGTGGTINLDDTGDAGGVNPFILAATGTHTITAPISLANGVTLIASAGANLNISGNISGTGPVTKDGDGVVSLSGNNTWGGNTLVVLSGTIALGSSSAASTGPIVIGDNTTDTQPATVNITAAGLTIANEITTQVDLTTFDNLRTINGTYTGGTSTVSGTINLNGGVVLSAASGGTLAVSGKIQDGTDTHTSARRAIHVAGAGTVVLSNVETNTGETTVDGGTLVLSSGASLAGPKLNVLTGATAFIHGSIAATADVFSSGTLHFDGNTGGSPLIKAMNSLNIGTAGLVTIGASSSKTAPVVIQTGAVDFSGDSTGKLDIANNRVLTTNTLDVVRQQILFNNIYTSAPGGAVGYVDNGGGVTKVGYTLAGDADFNFTVDTVDFGFLVAAFSQTGQTWANGDFNYDGTVDTVDFGFLVANFSKVAPGNSFGGALVPEPASLSLLSIAGLVATRRRRTR